MHSHGLEIQVKEMSEAFALCFSSGETKPQIKLSPWKLPLVPREGRLISISANFSDLSDFGRLYHRHHLKDYLLNPLAFFMILEHTHPCTFCVNSFCIYDKYKEPNPVQAHVGKSATPFNST